VRERNKTKKREGRMNGRKKEKRKIKEGRQKIRKN
jgi:hypothetical protein